MLRKSPPKLHCRMITSYASTAKLQHDSLALFLMENCSTEASTQRWPSSVNLPPLRVHLPTTLPRSSSTEFPSGPERLPCCCSPFGCGVSETPGGNTGRGVRTPANARNTSTRGCGLLTGKTGAKPITEVMTLHLHKNCHCASMCTCDCVMSCYSSDFEKMRLLSSCWGWYIYNT